MSNNQKLTFSDVLLPLLFVTALFVVKLIEIQHNTSFANYGIYPRKFNALPGIFFSPFIHSDWDHLINNAVPMFLLGLGLFYFYKPVAAKIYLYSMVITGIWVWAAARPSYHIGASGLVYAFASFIFFSGFIRKYYRLIALSLTVVFIYGSLIWGIFPIKHGISWESHLFGGIAGFILALHFKKYGPQPKKYAWSDDDNDDEDEDKEFENSFFEEFPTNNDIKNEPNTNNNNWQNQVIFEEVTLKKTSNSNNMNDNSQNQSATQPLHKIVYRYKKPTSK